MRAILRPGTHVLRRGDGELQVGLDPATALVLPDAPSVRDTLLGLSAARDVRSSPDTAVVAALREHDLVLDERDLLPLLRPREPARGTPRRRSAGAAPPAGAPVPDAPLPPVTAAVSRTVGSAAGDLLRSRRRWRIGTAGFGHPAGAPLRDQLTTLLGAAGFPGTDSVGTTPVSDAAPAGVAQATPDDRSPGAVAPDCGVLLGVGEPDRELLDGWTRGGVPHLLVRLTEGRAVVGPFVVPGRTACLRCLDAHCTDADPAWPLLVRQYAACSVRDRADGAPEPLDPLLAAMALAWAARDLTCFADGGRPTSWSSTVTFHPHPGTVETRGWLRHPDCGCSWDDLGRSGAPDGTR